MYLLSICNDVDVDSVREAMTSAGGDAEQALEILRCAYRIAQEGKPAAIACISFRDHFAGTTVTMSSPYIPWLPNEQTALPHVVCPLILLKAVVWFLARQLPAAGTKRLRQQQLPPIDLVRDGCPPRVRARAVFGCAAMACRRLASAPGTVLVSDRTMRRWAEWVMERVTRGLVRRVQVQPQRPAAAVSRQCVCV
jgi:hypothetical protein